jgi:hypothetical protein
MPHPTGKTVLPVDGLRGCKLPGIDDGEFLIARQANF